MLNIYFIDSAPRHQGAQGHFEEYATLYVLSTIQAHSAKHNRTDIIVFDVYRSNSVKIEAK